MMWPYGVRTFRSHRGRAGPAAPRGATSSSSTASTCRERARRSTSTARSTVFAAGAAILCYMAISPAEAHDASHPELDGWYEKLESGKGACCDGSDSAHVEPSDWETQNKPRSHYKVRLDGVWADVPDEAAHLRKSTAPLNTRRSRARVIATYMIRSSSSVSRWRRRAHSSS